MVNDAVLRVMILGEIGVGKSSVINLIIGKNVAEVSSNAKVCTRHTTEHEATVESMEVHIWEVSGFNQPKNDPMKDATDIEQKLGPMLKAHARIDVILFCMRGKKLTVVTKRIFELVDGIFGGRIPIVLVINHLEQEEEMEDWWRRNKDKLGTSMSKTRHVCVTGLQDADCKEKSQKSREELIAVLRNEYPSRGHINVPLESALKDYFQRNGQTGRGRSSWLSWLWGGRVTS